MIPKVGTTAPEFDAPVVGEGYHEESRVTLSSLRGQKVALVFYPKDSTTGWTIQLKAIRDRWSEVQQKASVFGVSADSVKSHDKFICKQSFPFPLISDEAKEVVTAYGVWAEKSLFGKKYMGINRTTIIIDEDGMIETVLEKVKPGKHIDDLLAALA